MARTRTSSKFHRRSPQIGNWLGYTCKVIKKNDFSYKDGGGRQEITFLKTFSMTRERARNMFETFYTVQYIVYRVSVQSLFECWLLKCLAYRNRSCKYISPIPGILAYFTEVLKSTTECCSTKFAFQSVLILIL